MAAPILHLQADLSFTSTSVDGSPGVSGTVTADGTTIDVTVSGPLALGGKSAGRVARQIAGWLAKHRLRLVLHGPEGMVVALGDVRTPGWQRLVTRSPYIESGRVRDVHRFMGGFWTSRHDRRSASPLVPPLPLFPLFPTVSSLAPRRVTTTHDPRGGGMPRLYFALSQRPQPGDVQRVEYLTRPHTTIGSAPDCDIRVDGLEPIHTVIDRTDDDEYVLTHAAPVGTSTVAGRPAQGNLLRTGAAITLGSTKLTYLREEYADHGRPYGGRIGGELGHQRPQQSPRSRERGAAGRPRTSRDPGRYYPP